MPYPIEQKLVIGVASSALFDLTVSDDIYTQEGVEAYRWHQEQNLDEPFPKGVEQVPVEVLLLSRNSPETGLRVFRSINHYGLDITRAAFMSGRSPYEYIPAFNASLFLSANEEDVQKAIDANYPAGRVLPTRIYDDEIDTELRVAFDFDGVIADDEAERVYKRGNSLDEFQAHEQAHQRVPHTPGPLADLYRKLSLIRTLEDRKLEDDPHYILRIAIVTARNAPSHERVVTTLKDWGVSPDECFFLGGMEKPRVLSILKPHVFFDDQRSHLHSPAGDLPMVHVPFGVANRIPTTEPHVDGNPDD